MTDSVRPWDALGLTSPFRRDCALAALVALLSVDRAVVSRPDRDRHRLRRADPAGRAGDRAVPAPGAAAGVHRTGARPADRLSAVVPTGQGVRGPAVAIAVYTCGTLLTVRRSCPGRRGGRHRDRQLCLVQRGAGHFDPPPSSRGWPPWPGPVPPGGLAAYGGAALIGQNVAMRRRYAELVELRAAEAARAQAARVESALAAERTRMARELHDVAAHHLTSVIVQAALVERLVERDPAAARTGAITVREEGRKALSNSASSSAPCGRTAPTVPRRPAWPGSPSWRPARAPR